jgi:hypothetical protein
VQRRDKCEIQFCIFCDKGINLNSLVQENCEFCDIFLSYFHVLLCCNEVGWAILVRCSVTVYREFPLFHAHIPEFLLIVFILQFAQVETQDKSQVFCFHIVICTITDFTKLSKGPDTYYSGCIFEIKIFRQGCIAYASFDITKESVNNIILGDC